MRRKERKQQDASRRMSAPQKHDTRYVYTKYMRMYIANSPHGHVNTHTHTHTHTYKCIHMHVYRVSLIVSANRTEIY